MSKHLMLALLVAITWPASAEIYEWRDAQGNVNYSDQPPPSGVNAKVIRAGAKTSSSSTSGDATAQPSTPAPAPNSGEKTLAEKELEFRQRKEEAAKAKADADAAQAREADRQRMCEQVRNQLKALESGQRVSRFNAQGERVFLDDSARAEEIERNRAQLSSNCQ